MELENDSGVLNFQEVGVSLIRVRREEGGGKEEVGFVGQEGKKEGAERKFWKELSSTNCNVIVHNYYLACRVE
jgi:hypothetical protein